MTVLMFTAYEKQSLDNHDVAIDIPHTVSDHVSRASRPIHNDQREIVRYMEWIEIKLHGQDNKINICDVSFKQYAEELVKAGSSGIIDLRPIQKLNAEVKKATPA